MSASAGCGHKATKAYDRVVPKAEVVAVDRWPSVDTLVNGRHGSHRNEYDGYKCP